MLRHNTGLVSWVLTDGKAGDELQALSVAEALGLAPEIRRVRPGAPFTWAGAIFHPGPSPVHPADLSRFRALRFHARGDGGTYRLILFSRGLGPVPAIREFHAGPEWTRHTFALREFSGMDGHDLTGVLFSGGPAEGPFAFWIDDVEFV